MKLASDSHQIEMGYPIYEADAWFRTILYSIGDGIITTDLSGCVQHMNHVAENLTGWKESEAQGKPVNEIFTIIHEVTGAPEENPVVKVFREKSIVGLQNHTLLIAKDGRRTPIADNASPIRNGMDEIIGVVLVFRDQSAEQKTRGKLRRIQSLLEKTQELVGLGGWELNPSTGTGHWSKEMFRLHGIEPADDPPTFEGFLDLIHPDDRDRLKDLHRTVLQSKQPFECEYRTNPKYGTSRIISASVEFAAENDREFQLFGTCIDITEQKRTQEALAQERSLLRTVIDNIPDAIYAKDIDGRKILANRADLANAGKTAEQMLGKTDFEVFPHDIAKKFDADDKAVMNAGEALIERDELLINRQGQQWWLRTSKIPWRNVNGEVIGLVGIGHDITQRKLTEEALRKREELYRTTLYSIGDGVITTNADGQIEQMNPIAEELTGWKELEAHGNLLDEIFRIVNEKTRETVENPVDKVIRLGRIVGLANHTLLIARDGKETPIADSAAPIMDESNRVVGVVLVFRDQTAERDAEKLLMESEERFRTIVENSTVGIYRTTPDRRVLMANPKILEILGYDSIDELYTKNQEKNGVMPEATWQVFREKIERDGEIRGFESSWFRKDRSVIFIRENARAIYGKDGKILYYEGTIEDITVRKKAEDALTQERILLKTVIDNIPAAVYVKDREGRKILANHADLANIGKSESEVIGKTDFDVYPPEVAERIAAVDREIITYGKSIVGAEVLLENQKGRRIWMLNSKLPLRNKNNEIIGIVGIALDISDRKLAEEALRGSEDKYRQFFEKDLTADFIASIDGTIVMFNPAFLKVFGFRSAEEVIGTSEVTFWPCKDRRQDFINTLKTQRSLTYYPLELKRRDGSVLYAIANIVGIFNDTGELEKMQMYLFDETPKKILQEQIRQAQKLESLGTLAGGIAHDFNNILSIIMGHASLVEPGVTEAKKLTRSIDAINKATERGAGLVNQLLTIARKTEVVVQSAKINDVISEITKLISETFPKTIVVETKLQANLPYIIADVTQIHQVLLNLCVNARDAMPDGGRITISSSIVDGSRIARKITGKPAEAYVRIQLMDTGSGMDETIRDRIFDPFFTTKGPGKGTGLGLSLAYSIIESHHGYITVDSEVGAGTTFDLYLPIQSMEQKSETSSAERTTAVQGGTETVLIIEDEELIREFLLLILVEKGYKVITAQDGEEGVKQYTQHKKEINVVVSDLGLPKVPGDEVFRRIKRINPQAKIILASGFIDPEVKSKIYSAGARQFIRKPYAPDELLRIIRYTLDTA